MDIFNGKNFQLVLDEYEAASQSDAVLLLTDWQQFKQIDYLKIHGLMKRPIFIDAKNLLDPDSMRKMGFNYLSVGRK